jgi:hypothetical protein
MPGPGTAVGFAPGPALPFGEASVVILGRPINAQPYLSENGRVVTQPAGAIGTPLQRGGRYVLFLWSTETIPRFFVHGAWELRAGRDLAIQVHSFSEQKSELLSVDEKSFLEAVRAAAR